MFEGQKPAKKDEHLRWTVMKLGWGKKIRGWKAGPNLGIICHFVPTSKPCVKVMTAGGLECRFCDTEFAKGFTGYLPFIDEVGQKTIGLYGADFEEIISEIPYGAEITVRKGDYKAAPIIYTQKEWCGHPCPWLGRLKVQHDIRPFLMQLWKNQELKEYYGMLPEKIPVPVTPKPADKKVIPDHPFAGKLAERFRQVEPSTNGKHSNPPKG